jgi:uncharacterized membrane protein
MVRLFSWKPSLTFRGRKFKGLRGFSGKPFHPPLTDVPVTCYLLVGIFDLISFATEGRTSVDFMRAGTFTIVAGAIASVLTILTGFWDWLKSTPSNTQTWRTANAHMAIMLTVTVLVIIDIVVRLGAPEDQGTGAGLMLLSLVIAGLVALGANYGGTLVYDYAFNVEQDIDYAYERSERDVLPGEHGS